MGLRAATVMAEVMARCSQGQWRGPPTSRHAERQWQRRGVLGLRAATVMVEEMARCSQGQWRGPPTSRQAERQLRRRGALGLRAATVVEEMALQPGSLAGSADVAAC